MLAHVAENRRITNILIMTINMDISTGPFWPKSNLNSRIRPTWPPLLFRAMALLSNVAEQQTVKDEGVETVVVETPTQASSALGRRDSSSMLPPQTTPSRKGPPLVFKTRYPKSSPSAPGTLGVSPSGVPVMETPGPSFGGSYTPESVAGSVFPAFRPKSRLLTRSIRMCATNDADRQLRTFPRAAFDFIRKHDPPKLDIIGGHKGPGWFANLQQEHQLSGPVFKLAVELKCCDYCHKLTAKSHTALKLLLLAQVEYLRFGM